MWSCLLSLSFVASLEPVSLSFLAPGAYYYYHKIMSVCHAASLQPFGCPTMWKRDALSLIPNISLASFLVHLGKFVN